MPGPKQIVEKIRTFARWVVGEARTVMGEEGASPRARLIAFVALASLVMVVAFALRLVGSYRRGPALRVATGASGTEYHTFGEALKRVVEKRHRRLRIELVTDTRGSRDSVERLGRREVDLALAQNDTPARESVKSIALLFEEVLHLYVREDAGIERVDQLKGKRIATLPEGSGTASFLSNLMSHFGADGGDDAARIVYVDPEEAHSLFRKGEVDAVFHTIALGETAKRFIGPSFALGARLIPIEQAAALKLMHPFLEATVIPKGFYGGYPAEPESDVQTASVRSVLLVHEDVNRDVVYKLTRLLHEYRNELVNENALAASVRRPERPEEILFPLHRGARAFYEREKPGFLVLYADSLALFLSIIALLVSGLWHLRMRLAQRRKDRSDMYNVEIVGLVDRLRRTEDPDELEAVRQGLFDIFGRVMDDVAEDRISVESFQFFAFPWEMAICAMRHREWLLGGVAPAGRNAKGAALRKPGQK